MKTKLTKEQSDFIKDTFNCMHINYDSKNDCSDKIFFSSTVFIQPLENSSEIFETKNITELSKEEILEIISCILKYSIEPEWQLELRKKKLGI